MRRAISGWRNLGADETARRRAEGLEPILVLHAGGRTGTTLLMQLLATSDLIAFDRTYPFEVRYLSYLLRWSAVLEGRWEAGAAAPDGWSSSAVMQWNRGTIGPFPYDSPALWNGDSASRAAFASAWREFSVTARERTSGTVRYYAEKAPDWVPSKLRGVLPFYSLVLVRDPRDVFLSIGAFDRRRGFAGFSRRPDDDDWSFARRFVELCRSRHKVLREEEARPESLRVKYEDLVSNLAAEAERLGRWLGIALNAALVESQAPQFTHHMTSESPAMSVGRWRREMPPDLRDFFDSALADELRHFGYV